MKISAARHIETFLKDHQEEMIIFLKKLVVNESPSHDAKSQQQIMEILVETFQSLDYYAYHKD